jgi:hypothetical protein
MTITFSHRVSSIVEMLQALCAELIYLGRKDGIGMVSEPVANVSTVQLFVLQCLQKPRDPV